MRTKTHWALAALAASALALAGCGGGSSSTTMVTPPAGPAPATPPAPTTPEPTTPPEPTPITVTLPELPMAAEHAFALATGEHTIMAGESLAAGGVMLSCAAGGEDCVVTVDADGAITATGGEVTPTLTTAAAEALEEEKMAAAEMKTQRAIGQAAALANGGTGTAQTFTATRGAGKDPSISGAAGYTAADEQPGMLGKFAGIARVNTTSAARTDHLVVYTDIAAPKLAEFYNYDGDSETSAVYESATLARPANDALPLNPGTVAGNQGKFSAGNIDLMIFPTKAATSAEGSVQKKFSVNADPGNTGANTHVSRPGTFDGASGTYTCTPATVADGCTVSVSPAGMYSFGTGDVWTFTPIEGAKAYREDGEFLTFGWWMRVPAKATGTYSFDTHYGGLAYAAAPASAVTETNAGEGVTGDATYSGNAAGRYVVGDDAGAFTADATLTAKFENATTVGSISGSITNFQGAAGGMSGWSVALKKITINALVPGTAGDPAFQSTGTDTSASTYDGVVATLGDVMAYGNWQGAFYGNAKNAAADGGGNKVNAAPLAVAGEFHADGAGANIAGAFGARR